MREKQGKNTFRISFSSEDFTQTSQIITKNKIGKISKSNPQEKPTSENLG